MAVEKQITEFGIATLCSDGYYHITSRKEGNNGKKLCRLIYENHHGIELPSTIHVHHINGDKSDDSIENLEALYYSTHHRKHMIGENNPFYGKEGINKGKKFSKETCKKISENHADVSGENNPKWGTSVIEEWGGLWFLKEMKKQVRTMKCVSEYTGISVASINSYIRRRGCTWSTLLEEN